VTYDPYIPWELIHPYTSQWTDETPWCLTFKMTRWLRKDLQGNGNESTTPNISLQQFACVAPTYNQPKTLNREKRFILQELPFAQREKEQLSQLIIDHNYHYITPNKCDRESLKNLLQTQAYTWLHIAAHGDFQSTTPNDASAIFLDGEETLTLNQMRGQKIASHIENNRPAFFFNTCHGGRQIQALTGLGGWVNHVMKMGAGLVIAPQWEVSDTFAYQFAINFYQKLLEGKTVAEAIYHSRLEAKNQGDSTWLAYSVYGHPNAKIN
jgi:CHAT domain-containing protein